MELTGVRKIANKERIYPTHNHYTQINPLFTDGEMTEKSKAITRTNGIEEAEAWTKPAEAKLFNMGIEAKEEVRDRLTLSQKPVLRELLFEVVYPGC